MTLVKQCEIEKPPQDPEAIDHRDAREMAATCLAEPSAKVIVKSGSLVGKSRQFSLIVYLAERAQQVFDKGTQLLAISSSPDNTRDKKGSNLLLDHRCKLHANVCCAVKMQYSTT
jgi:hypothetical protein